MNHYLFDVPDASVSHSFVQMRVELMAVCADFLIFITFAGRVNFIMPEQNLA
jgi:hypothetical protein